jgi:hypothetical protein
VLGGDLAATVAAAQTAVVAARDDVTDLTNAFACAADDCETLRNAVEKAAEQVASAKAALGTSSTTSDASQAASACAGVGAQLRGLVARVALATESSQRGAEAVPTDFPLGEIKIVAAPLAEAMAVVKGAVEAEVDEAVAVVRASLDNAGAQLEELEEEAGALLHAAVAGANLLLDWRKDANARRDLWRVRQRALTHLLLLQVKGLAKADTTRIIARRRALESEAAVLRVVEQPDYAEQLKEATSRGWEAEEEAVEQALEARAQAIEEMQAQAHSAKDPSTKALLLAGLASARAGLKSSADGCRKIGNDLDIVVPFLAALDGRLARLEEQMTAILTEVAAMREGLARVEAKLDAVGADVKFLVGPSLDDLLETHRQEVLTRGLPPTPIVPLYCTPIVPLYFNDGGSEAPVLDIVDQFLQDSTQRVLVIIGDAGSGKSVLTRVLEHRQACDGLRVGGEAVNLLVTPLPSLDAPAVDWVPETLRRIYGFSERRVAEAQKRTTNKVDPLRLLIIGSAR